LPFVAIKCAIFRIAFVAVVKSANLGAILANEVAFWEFFVAVLANRIIEQSCIFAC
jgi:hypothetical protein